MKHFCQRFLENRDTQPMLSARWTIYFLIALSWNCHVKRYNAQFVRYFPADTERCSNVHLTLYGRYERWMNVEQHCVLAGFVRVEFILFIFILFMLNSSFDRSLSCTYRIALSSSGTWECSQNSTHQHIVDSIRFMAITMASQIIGTILTLRRFFGVLTYTIMKR